MTDEIRDFFVVFEKFRFVGQWETKHFLGWPKPGIQFVFFLIKKIDHHFGYENAFSLSSRISFTTIGKYLFPEGKKCFSSFRLRCKSMYQPVKELDWKFNFA